MCSLKTSENYYGHSSNSKKMTKEEYYQLLSDLKNYDDEKSKKPNLATLLLDSSLIIESKWRFYSIKLIFCGDYLYLYHYDRPQRRKVENYVNDMFESDLMLISESEKEVIEKKLNLKEIEKKNVVRSRMNLERLVKTNENVFKTFITLTFEENVDDIDLANKKFHQFMNNFKKRKFPDLKYVCVPEFQKRGAVHYHLLTNIEYDDVKLLSKDEKKIYKPNDGWQVFKVLKFWRYGFSNVQNMRDVNVVGYITKYMTKDIDHRLFGHRRYLYSRNLDLPKEMILNLNNIEDFKTYVNKIPIESSDLLYSGQYFDNENNVVNFYEYKMCFN